ncbi:MAG: hypothetical protein K8J08_08975, partial [Thermoanaerobaculia bacterium]|nr:hypothetical protein [Thermoanaerobaculia bacterium]
ERLVARLERIDDHVPSQSLASDGRLEGLFSGGTLALEVADAISGWLAPLETNLGIGTDSATGAATHRILDLGADEFTVGRPHPMIDGSLRLDRLRDASADRSVGTVLLDVVLGDGAESDPAADLAPAIEKARKLIEGRERELRVGILLIGSEQDPQNRESQRERLVASGATVLASVEALVRFAADGLLVARPSSHPDHTLPAVDLAALHSTPVINVGLDSFVESFSAQGAEVVAVDWRPPAGGDDRLAQILRRMKGNDS